MKQYILLLVFFSMVSFGYSNTSGNSYKGESSPNTVITQLFNQYVKYPEKARDKKVEATVWVSLRIEKDGSITNIQQMTHHGYNLESEVLRVIAILNEKHKTALANAGITGEFNLPIKFELQ